LKDVPPGRRVRVLFQDESRFGRISNLRRCWGPLPQRPNVGQQIIREFVYAMGAVSPNDGMFCSLLMPRVDADIMSIFLAHTALEFADDFCILFLDSAGWHIASNLRIPPSMKLLYLPAYSPELNPIEHIWEHIRENYFKNQTFDSLDQVEATLVDALRSLYVNPNIVRSMTNFDWLNTLCLTCN
jgi:hypothetical protein